MPRTSDVRRGKRRYRFRVAVWSKENGKREITAVSEKEEEVVVVAKTTNKKLSADGAGADLLYVDFLQPIHLGQEVLLLFWTLFFF